ncbi:adenosylhomocysteinase [Cryptosporangium aurantiacum]|uniref:Adenosylhomocysteinase n=1 Tax=Cryptosporangium aurantiacum TaxID=134849 RepID=A0A1M7TYT3_9ACTN|nr:adenosylhomocysteinase [Cryptosporangium aurantiacum]SHN75823.1 adenosylhomocysteinase [Cryptosporangium aurantiacum]
MQIFETARLNTLDRYFAAVTDTFGGGAARSLLITHLLPDRAAFVRAVNRVAPVTALLPKPKSADPDVIATLSRDYPVGCLSRGLFSDAASALAYLEHHAPDQDVVLLDVGGYFAPTLGHLCDRFSGRVVGVVEDTENGWRRYRNAGKPPCPIFSVARSALKRPEDHLVGYSLVFSAEALIRGLGDIVPGRATVLGYGKIGASIARCLHGRGVQVTVYDTDPVRTTEALAHGHTVATALSDALRGAGLVLSATGNKALRGDDFALLADGAYLGCVTSSEDELDVGALRSWERVRVGDHVVRYSRHGKSWYALAGGEAVNFLHGAVVGPAIALVQAEILAAAARCVTADLPPGYHGVAPLDRRRIAALWLTHFREPLGDPRR